MKQVVQKLVKQKTIELVDRDSNQAVLREEMSLIGEKGDRALNQSPVQAQNVNKAVDPDAADLRVDGQAFEEVKSQINEFIRRNTLEKK